jgi:hypothetical protein
MTKYNEDLLSFYKNKYLGYMTTDSANLVEVTDRGFVYKGELIVAIEGLRDMIVEKPKVTVGDLVKSKKVEERKVFTVDVGDTPVEKAKEVIEEPKVEVVETPKVEEPKEEPKVEVKAEVPPAPRKRGPKPKKR